MTDRTFTATELHELLSGKGTAADKVHALYDMLIPMLQKRPTLADMTDEERDECQWMQADVYDTEGEWVIRESPHSNAVQLVNRAGKCLTVAAKDVTPRPDLPRLEWPGDTPTTAPALPDGWRLADHPHYGRVLVTWETPDRDGDYYVQVADGVGDTHPLGRFVRADELAFLDTDQEVDQ